MRRIAGTSAPDLAPSPEIGKAHRESMHASSAQTVESWWLSATVAFTRRLRQALPLSLSLSVHISVQALFSINFLSRYLKKGWSLQAILRFKQDAGTWLDSQSLTFTQDLFNPFFALISRGTLSHGISIPLSESKDSNVSFSLSLLYSSLMTSAGGKVKMEEFVDKNDVEMEVLRDNTSLQSRQRFPRDEAVLARFGKKQQFRRGFGLLPVVGLTSTLMITWEVITSTLFNALENGGPAGLVYGYLFVWCGAILQALVMAEMASMIPLAGGPFNWVAILAPPSCRKFLSYLAGWLTVISWQALVAGTAYVAGTLVQGLLILNHPDYDYERWHGTLLFYAVVAFSLFINTYLGRLLPQIESLMLYFHILGFFGILIPLVHLAPHQPAKEVFATFYNGGGWSTNGLSFFVGLVTAMDSFPGLDAADHIAEEIQNAPYVIPLSMGVSTMLNGILGFAMLIALLFCMPSDISDLLEAVTFYPFMSIYTYAVGSTAGATAMACVVVITQFFASVGILATASRMLWAFAREGGLPGSKYLAKVDQRTYLPLYAIGATTIVNLLLALINIGSAVGFGAFISLIVASYYSSFILSASVMLNKRLRTPDSEIPWGPFRLGRFGVPVTITAILYSLLGAFFSMWPTVKNPNIQEMNYCVLVYGGVMLFSMLFWLVYGRHHYTGPVVETTSRE